MKHTATCPSCNKEINILRIMFAVTPFSFKCGHCGARIFVRKIKMLILSVMSVMGMSTILLFEYIFRTGKYSNNLYFLAPFSLVMAIQIITGLLVCNKAKLETKINKKDQE